MASSAGGSAVRPATGRPANPAARRPVMADVARLAGVSHQTVSRVVNDHPNVRPQTRESVLAAISKLAYRPNAAARTLVTRRTHTLGVISCDTDLVGPASMLYGIEQAAAGTYFVSIASLPALDQGSARDAVERLLGQGVEGIIVIAPSTSAVDALGGMPARVLGQGAPVLVRKALGPEASEDQVAHSLKYFIDYYRDHAMDDTTLYPGVRDALDRLHAGGVQLAILTNKPVRISESIMNALGLTPMLFRVYGGNSFDQKKPNPIGIDTLRREAGIDAHQTWMVGDSIVDMQTARNAGVYSCGVTYGLQPETLGVCPPDLLVDRMEDFAAHILQG